MSAEKYVVVVLPPGWAKQVTRDLAAIKEALRIIHIEQEQDMASIDDELTTIEGDEAAEQASLAALTADETRELADLQALKDAGQALTPEQEQRFASLDAAVKANTAALDADTAAIDTADPAPADTAPEV